MADGENGYRTVGLGGKLKVVPAAWSYDTLALDCPAGESREG